MMTDPWSRRAHVAAYGLIWSLLLVAATLGGLWAGPSAPAPSQPAPPPQTPPTQPQPGPTLTPPSPFVPQPGVPPQTLPPQKVAEVVIRGNERIPSEQVLAIVSTKVA